MERLSKADCRQEKTGSCRGCPIYDIAYDQLIESDALLPYDHERIWGNDAATARAREITSGINKTLCPEGKVMQMPGRMHHW